MTERPILFSGEMVLAILDGRKTQTRRIIKLPKKCNWYEAADLKANDGFFLKDGAEGYWHVEELSCPYGTVGDRLWVRETGWERPYRTHNMMLLGADTWEPYYYDADGLTSDEHDFFKAHGFKRRPSIHMPRVASRINLLIKNIRVERLQDISEEDAVREGIGQYSGGPIGGMYVDYGARQPIPADDAIQSFKSLWKSINGPESWEKNPWVWVVEFEKI